MRVRVLELSLLFGVVVGTVLLLAKGFVVSVEKGVFEAEVECGGHGRSQAVQRGNTAVQVVVFLHLVKILFLLFKLILITMTLISTHRKVQQSSQFGQSI